MQGPSSVREMTAFYSNIKILRQTEVTWGCTLACKLFQVSSASQRIYHEIDSQLIFLNFKAGFDN